MRNCALFCCVIQFSTSYPHVTCELPSVIASRLGDPQFALPPARGYLVLRWRSGEQHAQSISRPDQLHSKIERERGSIMFRHHRTWHLTYLQAKEKFSFSQVISSIVWQIQSLGTWQGFAHWHIDCLSRTMDILSLFAVEGSLVPAFHVIFADIYVYLPDIKPSVLFILA